MDEEEKKTRILMARYTHLCEQTMAACCRYLECMSIQEIAQLADEYEAQMDDVRKSEEKQDKAMFALAGLLEALRQSKHMSKGE
jgi:hypothetical protein